MKRPISIVAIIYCVVCSFSLVAQEAPAKPDFLLVELKTERNRLNYLNMHNADEAKKLAEEAATVRQVMINDFTDHFNRCPIYYFIDSNAEYVKNKQFDGVVLNKEMKPADIKPTQNYYIVYYGSFSEDKPANSSNYAYNNSERNGKGLIFLKPNFAYANVYISHMEYQELFIHKDKRYFFSSKKYDIGYFPLAGAIYKEKKHK